MHNEYYFVSGPTVTELNKLAKEGWRVHTFTAQWALMEREVGRRPGSFWCGRPDCTYTGGHQHSRPRRAGVDKRRPTRVS